MRLKHAVAAGACCVGLLGGCHGAPGVTSAPPTLRYDGPALVGTVSTVDHVTTVTFPADAFDRAARFTAGSIPIAVMGGADAPPDFDMTWAIPPVTLASGGFASLVAINGHEWVMLFDSVGTPVRTWGRQGNGPGEFMRPTGIFPLGGDTLLIPDQGNRRYNWLRPGTGVVRTAAMLPVSDPRAARLGGTAGVLPGHRLVQYIDYLIETDTLAISRPPTAFGVTGSDFGSVRVIDSVPGIEMAPVMTHYRGRARTQAMLRRLGQRPLFAVWDTTIAIATGADGYVIEQRNGDGRLLRRLSVPVVRRPVTAAMRQVTVRAALSRLVGGTEGMVDSNETLRLARESPFADSLPPYDRVLAAPDGLLWVVDAIAPDDTAWSATAFRSDGAMAGRLRVPGAGHPVHFDAHRVIVRTVDDDGVVSFKVYALHAPTNH